MVKTCEKHDLKVHCYKSSKSTVNCKNEENLAKIRETSKFNKIEKNLAKIRETPKFNYCQNLFP